MKNHILLLTAFFSLFPTSCETFVDDGGTVVRNYGVYKVIEWNRPDGKHYAESHVFPLSLFPLSFFDGREEKEFEKILDRDVLRAFTTTTGYVELHSLDTYPSSGSENYDDFVRRGKKTNYFLIKRMLRDEPTMFFIPNIAFPLTDGDIAFMLLCDINCADGWEEKLFPASVTKIDGYSARALFDFLHDSKENRIFVARKLLAHYIDDETLRNHFESFTKDEGES